jgi:DNA-binding transcriptional regulator YdaS (Cro superfamily)
MTLAVARRRLIDESKPKEQLQQSKYQRYSPSSFLMAQTYTISTKTTMVTTRRLSQTKLDIQKNWLIEALPGLNPEDCQKLKECGIETTLELCQRTRKRSSRQELATQMQISIRDINQWGAMADLSRVPSVGCQYCELLLQVGTYSVRQLAQVSWHDLRKRVSRFQMTTTQQPKLSLDPELMAQWIQEARQLMSKDN